MTRVMLLLIAVFAGSSSALASVSTEIKAIDAKLKACIDKDDSNLGMMTCTGDAYDAADKILNRLYSSIVEGLKSPKSADDAENDKETLRRLTASERAWVTYRDADCTLQGTEMLGGSGENLVIENCSFSMTKQRVKALDDLLNTK